MTYQGKVRGLVLNKKLTDVALSDRVYSELRKDLIAGRYQPGERITISSLAEKFGVSPTPVREAIRLLLAQGGLDLRPNHSVTVVALSSSEYRDTARIRMRLEGMAATEAAGLRTDKQLAQLIRTNERLEYARSKGRYSEVLQRNREFHFALAEMARMPILTTVLENLWMRSGPLFNVLYDYEYRQPLDDHPHDDLLKAIEKQDATEAESAIRRDIKRGADIIVGHLERLERADTQDT